MTITQVIHKLKKEYLFKQVLRLYSESEEIGSSSALKEYYLSWRDENKIPYWCDNSRCLLHKRNPRWNGKKITLEVGHIEANKRNWKPTNLRLLCPNCHSQRDAFRRNI